MVNAAVQGNAFAIDASGVYFANDLGPLIARASLDGGAPQTLVSGVTSPSGIAIDGTNVYFAEQNAGETSDIRYAPEAGGDGGAATLLSNLVNPGQVLVEGSGANATIYFGSGGGISRTIPDGGLLTISPMFLNRSGSSLGYLAVDGPYLYWATDSQVFRALK